MTKRALAEPFLVPSPNAGVLEASFDLPTVDCEVLGQVGELLGRLYRSCLRAWITDASTAHLAATDEADTVTAPLFAAAKQAETAATESGLGRDTKAARVVRRKAEKAWRDTYRDSFYEFEKVWMRDRKRVLTTEVSSRQAGTIVRAAKKQRELSLGNLDQLLKRDTVEIALIQKRLALQVRSTSRSKRPDRPSKSRRVKGFADKHERRQKQRRLQILQTRLADTTSRIAAQKPKVCVGTAKLLKQRHNLEAAGLTEQQWQQRWNAARMIVGGTGETGKPFGNDTIRVMPTAVAGEYRVMPSSVVGEYMVMVRLPKDLEHLSNTRGPQAMYQLDARIVWDSRNRISGSRATKTGEWHQRIIDNQAVAYRLALDGDTGRWSLTASWTRKKNPRRNTNEQTPSATPVQSVAEVAYGRRCCGIDLNAGHFNAFILDKHANPQGAPIVYEIPQEGTSKQRQTRVCEALHSLARDHLLPADINHVAVEQLDFADIAAQGRNRNTRHGKAGRVTRGKTLSIPTSKFTYHAATIFNSYDIKLVAVDAAYSSIWGARDWQPALNSSRKQSGTRHDAGSVVLGRRSQGHGPRRNPGTPRNDQSRKAGSRKPAQGEFSAGKGPANAANPIRGENRTAGMPVGNGNDGPSGTLACTPKHSGGHRKKQDRPPLNRSRRPTDDTIIYPK